MDSDGDRVVDSLDYAPEDQQSELNLSNLPVTVTVLTGPHNNGTITLSIGWILKSVLLQIPI